MAQTPTYPVNLLDDDGLLYLVQYIFTKLKIQLDTKADTTDVYTYTLDFDNTSGSEQIVLYDQNNTACGAVTVAELQPYFGLVDGAQIDGVNLTVTNKKIQIPNAGASTRGVVSNADINTLINNALSQFERISFIKVANASALPQLYDSTATYTLDTLCHYNGMIYKCTTAIVTPEAFDPDHWTFVCNLNGTIFLVPSGGTAPDIYEEYVWTIIDASTTPVTYGYEKIGTTQIDLSGYVQKTDIQLLENSEIADVVDDAYDAVFNPSTP